MLLLAVVALIGVPLPSTHILTILRKRKTNLQIFENEVNEFPYLHFIRGIHGHNKNLSGYETEITNAIA